MKSFKALFVVTALSVASLAMAEGGAERTLARQASMEAARVASQQKDEAPVAVEPGKPAGHANC